MVEEHGVSAAAGDASAEEREKYMHLSNWLDDALVQLNRVSQPLQNFFDEYQVSLSISTNTSTIRHF